MIEKSDIYEKTNQGLDIIFLYYPQAKEVHGSTKKHFSIRSSDKTPSAALFLATEKDGSKIWKVKDFGSDAAMSPFDICMKEEGIGFVEAVYLLAETFHVTEEELTSKVYKPDFRKSPATPEEFDGFFDFKKKDKFTAAELRLLGPHVTQENCDDLLYYSLEYYKMTKDGVTSTISSNDNYPIFIRECRYLNEQKEVKSFYKLYQPLNPQKQYRFFYQGYKPKKYINGMFELQQRFDKHRKEEENTDDNIALEKEGKAKKLTKILDTFICSGERDALCVKSHGFSPLWFNSEGYDLSEWEFKTISKCVDRVYYIPDIDDAGKNFAHKLVLKHIDLYTIWLPERLRTYYDQRRRPRKDFRDYSEVWPDKEDFLKLFNWARPVRFWEYIDDGRGRKRLDINSDYVTYFLKCNGFVAIEDKNAKSGKMLAHISGNVVREIKLKDVKAFLKRFVWDRHEPVEIRNIINNSTRLSESNLDLDEVELTFEDYTPTSQFFFFENAVWEVTETDVKEHKPGSDTSRCVWEEELIKHPVKKQGPAFTVSKLESIVEKEDSESILPASTYDIQIRADHSSNFFKYLINASRMFWQKEFEPENGILPESVKLTLEEYKKKYRFAIDGPALSKEEIGEQKLHLVNKIFCIGYLLHRYKAADKGWAVYAMDNKIGESDESNGGPGKSFFAKALQMFMRSETLSGRDPKLLENKHLLENITEYTDMILVDDLNAYLHFDSFYDKITGSLTVNPKFNKSYTIPYKKAPKWIFTTNYTQRSITPSSIRRIIYTVFSDYYHQQTDTNGYKETRKIKDDFNKELFDEFYTKEEWNADVNFFVDCCQFYLSVVRKGDMIQPPMANVMSRTLLAMMGEPFYNWAEVYFSVESGNCDKLISKEAAIKDFEINSKVKTWSTQKFTKALNYYCQRTERIKELNPSDFFNSSGRIIKKIAGVATEMIYIRTRDELDLVNFDNYEKEHDAITTDSSTPLPF